MTKTGEVRTVLVGLAASFAAVVGLLWMDELLDLPHKVLGTRATPVNWGESITESIVISVLGLFVVIWSGVLLARIAQRDRKLADQNTELATINERLAQINANYMTTLRFVTHELKSPLAAIQMIVDIAVAGPAADVPEALRKPFVRIKRNCEELQDMVKNYLDLARAERGELHAVKRPINFRDDVVTAAVHQDTAMFQSRQIDLMVDCPGDLTVDADPELMRIALSNYLSNAAKYGREGGQARLTVAGVEGGIDVTVWNEGAGFTPEEGRALFEKFSRLHTETTRGKRGSGLGLYLCRQILELHGGTVRADSEPGQWAAFTFHFPRAVSEEKPTKLTQKESIHASD